MRLLACLLFLLPFGLSAQTAPDRAASHAAAQRAQTARVATQDFARARLRYAESFTEGDARTQRVSRDGVVRLMRQSAAGSTGQTAKNRRKLLELFERYSAAGSTDEALRVLTDFERSLQARAAGRETIEVN